MKYLTLFLITLFLLVSCSSSDSSEEMEEIVLNPPSLSTSSVTEITETSVTVGGNVTDDGGAAITERGVVWATSADPTTVDNKQSVGTGTGTYTTSINGLEANATYFVRAYAINSEGTAYGSQQQFTTLEPAPVQKVFEGDVYLKTQAEINAFGNELYTEITGKLICGDYLARTSEITSFMPFISLQKVGGLLIQYNDAITNLNGFENLIEVTEDITIRGNDALVNLDGLNNVSKLHSLLINFNDKLEIIDGFNNIEQGEYIQILGNTGLKVIDGFNSIKEANTISINSNTNIELIKGFSELQHLINIFIRDNEGYFEVDAFYKLISLEFLSVLDNPNLSSISGFENTSTLETVDIMDCENLESFSGFNLVEELNFCRLYRVNLTAFNCFRNLENLGDFYYSFNTGTSEMSNFENLIEANRVEITFNPNMVKIDGFSSLIKSSTSIYINWNESLESIGGFSSLLEANSISISNNIKLSDFCVFQELFAADSEVNFTAGGNQYNPTIEDIISGDCSE